MRSRVAEAGEWQARRRRRVGEWVVRRGRRAVACLPEAQVTRMRGWVVGLVGMVNWVGWLVGRLGKGV